ncbi:hypothetical protein [Hymenobacter yonginensis]|uniref:DUF3575 domain-containing protein n=1 Tax=Hymenobacter yonginensis TaxID=748197 RepID=A0ABY7PHT8_9BACT|nr:hypothetical protein [Hymenobacter yonginensis]WBO82879.1 hypothetical protein O9Z63_10825 [Hymenobacter yonginensis]
MGKRLLTLGAGWLLAGAAAASARAATPALPTTTTTDDSVSVRHPHRRPVFQLDIRNSIINHHLVTIPGLKLGVEWRGRLRTGLGVYLLSNGIPSRQPIPSELPAATRSELRLRYVAAYGEYVVLGNPRWEIATQLQLGVGRTYARYALPDGTVIRSPRKIIWLAEPSLSGQMRVYRWLALGTGLGWRQPVFVNKFTERELNGPVFYGRVKLSLGDLYKVARGRQRLFTQQGLRRADW